MWEEEGRGDVTCISSEAVWVVLRYIAYCQIYSKLKAVVRCALYLVARYLRFFQGNPWQFSLKNFPSIIFLQNFSRWENSLPEIAGCYGKFPSSLEKIALPFCRLWVSMRGLLFLWGMGDEHRTRVSFFRCNLCSK